MKYISVIAMNFFMLFLSNAHSATPDFCSGTATADINNCADYLLNKSDKKLNEKYKELLATLQPNSKDTLIKSQKLWISYRDKTCQIYQPDSDGRYSDGSYAGNEAYAEKKKCATDITEIRVIEFDTILNNGFNYSYQKARDYISENFFHNDTEKLTRHILDVAKKNKYWMNYALESCKLNSLLYKEDISNCLARLAFFDQPVSGN